MDLIPFSIDFGEEDDTNATFDGSLEENSHQLFKGFSSSLLNFASLCCILFMLVGIPGNLITIFALARCKKVRNATAVFIINLSFSDLLFCCFNLPLAASTFYHREWIHGDLMCRLFPLLRYGLLAVSLFTILTITINRYIMISHPRAYPRIYRRKYLTIMVALTWLCAFGTLIQTWRGRWGRFGLDYHIGSCSILPATNGSSPKEFLFLMAFALPCCAIVLCYARIFYIVRKTAMKTQDIHPKANGSVRLSHAANNTKSNSKASSKREQLQKKVLKEDGQKEPRLSISDNSEVDKPNDNQSMRSRPSLDSSNDQRTKKYLSKMKEEDLKFIDTSVESDLPPTLSQLQRKSVQISIDNQTPSSPKHPTAIISFENEPLNSIRSQTNELRVGENLQEHRCSHETVDSALESSNENEKVHQDEQPINGINAREASSSSSGIEIPCDINSAPTKPEMKRASSKARIKQRKLKEESPLKDMIRKKSLANTSGASILLAGRMTSKDRRLLKMILVIFLSFLTCYLPITLTKVFKSISDIHIAHIMGYLLVYLTTCINPFIYVVMSSEYRQAYKNLLTCQTARGNERFKSTRRR